MAQTLGPKPICQRFQAENLKSDDKFADMVVMPTTDAPAKRRPYPWDEIAEAVMSKAPKTGAVDAPARAAYRKYPELTLKTPELTGIARTLDGHVELGWESENAEFYSVWRKLDGDGKWQPIGETRGEAFLDSDLPETAIYALYSVRGHLGNQVSIGSEPVIVLLGGYGPASSASGS